MKNMTKGDRIFRIIVGILIALAFYVSWGRWLMWLIVLMMIITGITGYCPMYTFTNKGE